MNTRNPMSTPTQEQHQSGPSVSSSISHRKIPQIRIDMGSMNTIHPIFRNLYVGGIPEYSDDLEGDLDLIRKGRKTRRGLETIDLVLDVRSPDELQSSLGWAEHPGMPAFAYTFMHNGYGVGNDARVLQHAALAVEKQARMLGRAPRDLGVVICDHGAYGRARTTALYLLLAIHGLTPVKAMEKLGKGIGELPPIMARFAIAAHLGKPPFDGFADEALRMLERGAKEEVLPCYFLTREFMELEAYR